MTIAQTAARVETMKRVLPDGGISIKDRIYCCLGMERLQDRGGGESICFLVETDEVGLVGSV